MLHNNPMGSRRRRRFYHRAGIVPIPGEKLHEFYEVPIGFFSDFPETDLETINEKPKTKIVSVDTLMCRLIDIINQMIELDEAETRREEEEAKAKAKARKANFEVKAGPSEAEAGAGPSHSADKDQAAGADAAEADATKALAKDSKDTSDAKVEETVTANEAVADTTGTQPEAEND